MKVKLIKAARIMHAAGDIVEVSPESAHFLITTKQAEAVKEAATPKKAETKKKDAKK